MKKPLRALFYGQTHEHAPGKLETLKKIRDEFEIVAIVDDFPRKSPMYRDQKWDTADYPIVSEAEAWNIPDVDVGFVEADMNHAYNHDNYAEYMQTFEGGILYSLGCHLVGTVDLCPIERFDGAELKLALTLREPAVVRGERPNDQDYDRDLRVHDLTLKMVRG